MDFFDTLHALMKEIDKVEDCLRTLRDNVDLATKTSINGAIPEVPSVSGQSVRLRLVFLE